MDILLERQGFAGSPYNPVNPCRVCIPGHEKISPISFYVKSFQIRFLAYTHGGIRGVGKCRYITWNSTFYIRINKKVANRITAPENKITDAMKIVLLANLAQSIFLANSCGRRIFFGTYAK